MIIARPAFVFVSIGIHHAMHMRHIVICDLPCSVFFHIISYTVQKKLLNIKCVLSETFFILRRIKRDMIKNVYWSARKISFILVRF
jgi:hypothetical protein